MQQAAEDDQPPPTPTRTPATTAPPPGLPGGPRSGAALPIRRRQRPERHASDVRGWPRSSLLPRPIAGTLRRWPRCSSRPAVVRRGWPGQGRCARGGRHEDRGERVRGRQPHPRELTRRSPESSPRPPSSTCRRRQRDHGIAGPAGVGSGGSGRAPGPARRRARAIGGREGPVGGDRGRTACPIHCSNRTDQTPNGPRKGYRGRSSREHETRHRNRRRGRT